MGWAIRCLHSPHQNLQLALGAPLTELLANCPVCHTSEWFAFLSVPSVVVDIGRLFDTEQEAQQARRGSLELALCKHCGYIGNRAYKFAADSFAPGYEVSLHHASAYRKFLVDLADRLILTYNLQGKTILEVACGSGFFLRLMLERGVGQGIGIDPSLVKDGIEWQNGKSITWVRDFYDEHLAHLHADFIVCRQALHEIPEPRAFVESIRRTVGRRKDVRLYFEMVNAVNLFTKKIVWQLLYEYRSFLTADSLTWFFEDCDFTVLGVGPCYEDEQYVSIELAPRSEESRPASATQRPPVGGTTAAYLQDFADAFQSKIALWSTRLAEIRKSGRKVVAWGAAGRGITFLNLADRDHQIRYIVEINPARQGKYIPGTGTQVVSPEFLKDYKPDVIVLTNATYEREIRQQASSMGLTCEFLLA